VYTEMSSCIFSGREKRKWAVTGMPGCERFKLQCNGRLQLGTLQWKTVSGAVAGMLGCKGLRAVGARQWALAAGGVDEWYYREMQAIISGFSSMTLR